jgi:hypothetical protein
MSDDEDSEVEEVQPTRAPAMNVVLPPGIAALAAQYGVLFAQEAARHAASAFQAELAKVLAGANLFTNATMTADDEDYGETIVQPAVGTAQSRQRQVGCVLRSPQSGPVIATKNFGCARNARMKHNGSRCKKLHWFARKVLLCIYLSRSRYMC